MSNFKIIQSLRYFFGIEMAFSATYDARWFLREKKDEKKFSDVINN